jgi:cytoskeletal protein CcmA (bactofilin family)
MKRVILPMFGNRRNRKFKSGRVLTVIGPGTEIHGDISFSGGLHVDGIIKGNITGDHAGSALLSLSELGMIEGEVRVPIAVLNGAVLGNVYASERVELAPKSKVTGDVTYNLIEMSVGAEVNGRLLHKDEQPERLSVTSLVMLEADQPKKNRTDSAVPQY